MKLAEIQGSISPANDLQAIAQTMESLGLPESDCIPRENILKFAAWKELGRVVCKGQKSCAKVPCFNKKKDKKTGKITSFPGMASLFHVSQTKPLDEKPVHAHTGGDSVVSLVERPVLGDKFRGLADKMQGAIDAKFTDRQTNTPKRQQQAGYARHEGEHLQRTQAVLRALADLHDSGDVPDYLQSVTSKKSVYDLTYTHKDTSRCGYYGVGKDTGKPYEETEQTKAIFALLTPKSLEQSKSEDLARRVDDLQFSSIPGYFPTPKPVIDLMIEKADLCSNHRVLEPSAGHGAIVEELLCHGVEVSCCEIHHSLRDILTDKGYNLVGAEFLNHQGEYDCIVMNPPFEKLQDIDHVLHAFSLLGELGRVVAVMSPAFTFRSDAKCTSFRDFVDEHGQWEKLPDNSFKQSGTQVNTVLVTLDK